MNREEELKALQQLFEGFLELAKDADNLRDTLEASCEHDSVLLPANAEGMRVLHTIAEGNQPAVNPKNRALAAIMIAKNSNSRFRKGDENE